VRIGVAPCGGSANGNKTAGYSCRLRRHRTTTTTNTTIIIIIIIIMQLSWI
jgi:hypothetical protein